MHKLFGGLAESTGTKFQGFGVSGDTIVLNGIDDWLDRSGSGCVCLCGSIKPKLLCFVQVFNDEEAAGNFGIHTTLDHPHSLPKAQSQPSQALRSLSCLRPRES